MKSRHPSRRRSGRDIAFSTRKDSREKGSRDAEIDEFILSGKAKDIRRW